MPHSYNTCTDGIFKNIFVFYKRRYLSCSGFICGTPRLQIAKGQANLFVQSKPTELDSRHITHSHSCLRLNPFYSYLRPNHSTHPVLLKMHQYQENFVLKNPEIGTFLLLAKPIGLFYKLAIPIFQICFFNLNYITIENTQQLVYQYNSRSELNFLILQHKIFRLYIKVYMYKGKFLLQYLTYFYLNNLGHS